MPEPNHELIVPVLINGAVFALVAVIVPAFLLSRFTRDIIGRSVLVSFLFVAAGAYFGFATLGREVVDTQPIWTLVELAQVICFGTLALLGLRGSPYWIAAGWALHPLWDVLLHYVGPGHSFILGPMRSRVSVSIGWLPSISSSPMDWLAAVGWDSERSLLLSRSALVTRVQVSSIHPTVESSQCRKPGFR